MEGVVYLFALFEAPGRVESPAAIVSCQIGQTAYAGRSCVSIDTASRVCHLMGVKKEQGCSARETAHRLEETYSSSGF